MQITDRMVNELFGLLPNFTKFKEQYAIWGKDIAEEVQARQVMSILGRVPTISCLREFKRLGLLDIVIKSYGYDALVALGYHQGYEIPFHYLLQAIQNATVHVAKITSHQILALFEWNRDIYRSSTLINYLKDVFPEELQSIDTLCILISRSSDNVAIKLVKMNPQYVGQHHERLLDACLLSNTGNSQNQARTLQYLISNYHLVMTAKHMESMILHNGSIDFEPIFKIPSVAQSMKTMPHLLNIIINRGSDSFIVQIFKLFDNEKNTIDKYGYTPLDYLSNRFKPCVISDLIKLGAMFSTTKRRRKLVSTSIFHNLFYYPNVGLEALSLFPDYQVLKRGLMVNDIKRGNALHCLTRKHQRTILFTAIFKAMPTRQDCLDLICSTDGARKRSVLHSACIFGDANLLSLFIEWGGVSALNCRDCLWSTPLHYAVAHNHTMAIGLLSYPEIRVNERDLLGRTPLELLLHRTTLTNWTATKVILFEMLLNRGATTSYHDRMIFQSGGKWFTSYFSSRLPLDLLELLHRSSAITKCSMFPALCNKLLTDVILCFK